MHGFQTVFKKPASEQNWSGCRTEKLRVLLSNSFAKTHTTFHSQAYVFVSQTDLKSIWFV